MGLFRRGGRTADPYGRGREADEAIGEALGLPLAQVRPITDILRRPVTDQLCDLLPGVENSSAARLLILVCGTGAQMSVTAAQAQRPDIAFGHLAAAALPSMMLLAVTNELIRRYDVNHPSVPFAEHRDTAPPAPTPQLRAARADATCEPGVAQSTAAAVARAVHASTPDPLTRAWGGWALLAASTAIADHQGQLPEPGRARHRPADKRAGASAAGFSYQFGRTVLAGSAVIMIEA
ncbi:hypothetical protein HH310_40775 [Actinoplanes sp. TBRC 11911]|uniref:hypothetical protein n=1 Tax=Actinoplanes sp. TBRC 11911 TaxID=2729386 RepID=UPI00145E39D5|nr:hypothetical protein [Actinoplanes sp. TBRC 11911]NMO57492.1 hypothetical protein [Actinoplanes sp. TBRC 11911]